MENKVTEITPHSLEKVTQLLFNTLTILMDDTIADIYDSEDVRKNAEIINSISLTLHGIYTSQKN
jgi:hypothetical protein